MSMESTNITEAQYDRDRIDDVETLFRNALLGALSGARAMTVNMEPVIREKLMDGLTAHFHPDGTASDLFSDALGDAKTLADEEIEVRQDEAARATRHAAE